MSELLGEQRGVRKASSDVDMLLGQAMEANEDLEAQNARLASVGQRLGGLSKTFRALNAMMGRIDMRKRRDKMLVAGCFALGFFFLFIYYFYIRG